MTRPPGDGDRDRVRHLRAGRPRRQPDGPVRPGGQRLRRRPRGSGPRTPRGTTPTRRRCATPAGFEMGRGVADPSQLTDEEDPTLANVVLTNGARLYVDHAHPEYSSPEVTSPARRRRLGPGRRADHGRVGAPALRRSRPGVNLYKNNTDGKGAVLRHPRELPDAPRDAVHRHRAPPHAVLRRPPGHHRVRPGRDRAWTRAPPGYQLSQRSDFFEVEVGLETTLKRPIINTRDEPHAVADLYRRLHVIIGDANHCDVANLLKLGTTSLVLAMIEDRAIDVDLTVARPGRARCRRSATTRPAGARSSCATAPS